MNNTVDRRHIGERFKTARLVALFMLVDFPAYSMQRIGRWRDFDAGTGNRFGENRSPSNNKVGFPFRSFAGNGVVGWLVLSLASKVGGRVIKKAKMMLAQRLSFWRAWIEGQAGA